MAAGFILVHLRVAERRAARHFSGCWSRRQTSQFRLREFEADRGLPPGQIYQFFQCNSQHTGTAAIL
jgi:hypothetical protein